MEKLARFFILLIVFVITFLLMYSTLPLIVWLFGGEFLAVVQHPAYVMFAGITLLATLGIVFSECFDTNFYSKN